MTQSKQQKPPSSYQWRDMGRITAEDAEAEPDQLFTKERPVQLRLKDGSIVKAEKDCDCLDKFHTGPHWIYTNDLWKVANQKLLTEGNIAGYIHEEPLRLREKEWQMKADGIEEIIR